MITLEADNRQLTNAAKYSFLSTNYSSGVSVLNILNATDTVFAADAMVLIGNFGFEDAEIGQISSVDSTTGDITLTAVTKFAHSESSRVTVIPYNQIRFFWTSSTTFNISNPLTGFMDLQPSDWFSTYGDEDHASGYGWYTFYNSATNLYSQPSNYIPYAGFERDTVEDVLNDFYSLLGNKELKLVKRRDALSWLNEGYSLVRNKLNITNTEYTASSLQTLTIEAGTIEYELPSDFDHLVSLVAGASPANPGVGGNYERSNIEYIPLREAYAYTGSGPRYYIRGPYIGILPTPESATTYSYIYLKKSARLSSNTDQIILPNNGAYLVKDWMLYRAYLKFQNPIYSTYQKSFTEQMNQMIVASVKRDANQDKWGIERSANV